MAEQKQTHTVLICEADEVIVTQIKQVLDAAGWRIVGVATFEDEAVIMALLHSPDIIIMARTLEKEDDGMAAMRCIHKLLPGPMVLLSADTSEAAIRAALKAHACGVMPLPLDAEQIIPLLLQSMMLYKAIHQAIDTLNREADQAEAAYLTAAKLKLNRFFDDTEDNVRKVKTDVPRPKTKKRTKFIH